MVTITESIADRLTGGKLSDLGETAVSQAEQISEQSNQISEQSGQLFILTESLQRLEQLLHSTEWRMMSMQADQEFTRPGLREITKLSRIMRLKNPVIKRGVKIQRLYVWAQGVNISAVNKEINAVVQAFLSDERNRAELTSHQARGERETDLQQDGNLFFRYHINEANGRIRISTIDPQEVDDIICNPEDKRESWFYKRIWVQKKLGGDTVAHTVYYPDWRFIPKSKIGFTEMMAKLGGLNGRIEWDTPVYHVAVNKLGRWGVSEYYAANDWALAYKSFLEQLASVWQALARWAAKLTTKGGKRGVAAAKAKLNTTLAQSQSETNPPPVTGSTFIASEGVDLKPFRTAGATMSAEDGRRLLLMSIMDFGFPETFFGDASVGSLATAKSLDRPTELQIMDRQAMWRDIHMDILGFQLLWAAKAPQGALRGLGVIVRETDGNQVREYVRWDEDIDPTVSVDFPSIIEHDTQAAVGAIIDAVTLKGQESASGGIPLETGIRRILSELGVSDIDAVMELWREEQEAQPSGNTAPDIDNQESEMIWQRQVAAVGDLLTELREAVGQNGHVEA